MANSYIDLIIDRENNSYDIHDKRIPTLPNDGTKYLNGKGQWTVPTDTKNTTGNSFFGFPGSDDTNEIYFVGTSAQGSTDSNSYAKTFIPVKTENDQNFPLVYIKGRKLRVGALEIKDSTSNYQGNNSPAVYHRIFIQETQPGTEAQIGDVWIELKEISS